MTKENVIIKKDTKINWEKATTYIPKINDIIIYTDCGIKIGDGKTLVSDLPFSDLNTYIIDGDTLIINTRDFFKGGD